MSGKYIPPSRRNNASSNKTTIPIQNEYFPPLSTQTPTILPTKSGISFSALASEWNEKEVNEETARKDREEQDGGKRAFVPLLREYNNPEPYVYAVEEEETGTIPDKVADDGWKTVDKKARKQLSYEEQLERRRKFQEAEAQMYDDSSVWTSGDHRSDDWSHRDRRAV